MDYYLLTDLAATMDITWLCPGKKPSGGGHRPPDLKGLRRRCEVFAIPNSISISLRNDRHGSR